MKIELVYAPGCPNVKLARRRLLEAFSAIGVSPAWREWDSACTETPDYARAHGSPTILVNGEDVAGANRSADGPCCRLYETTGGPEPAPAVRTIAAALHRGMLGDTDARRTRGLTFAALPAIGGSLAPKVVCPLCWPAYTALLGAAGIGFVDYTPYLLPAMSVLLLLVLWALGYRARARWGYGPFLLGVAGSVLVVTGKFAVENLAGVYTGVALLVAASVWNIWPRRASTVSIGMHG